MRGNVPVRFGRGSPGRTQDHLVPRLAAYLVGRLQGEGAQVTDAHNPGGMRNAEHRNGLRVLRERDRVANTAQGHWRATYAERCPRGSEGGCAKKGFPPKGNTSSCTLPCFLEAEVRIPDL